MAISQNDRPASEAPPATTAASDVVGPDSPASSERPPWLGYFLALCLLGGGIAIGRFLLPKADPADPATVAAPQEPPPRTVETIRLERASSLEQNAALIGQVTARSNATIRAQTEGAVREVLVQPGDRVEAGALLVRLDAADQELALSQARARLAESQSELTRLETGTRQEILSQRQATLAAARAREAEARDNLDRNRSLATAGAIARRALVEAEALVDVTREERLEAEATLAEATAGPRVEDIETQRAIVAANRAAVAQARLIRERTEIRAAAAGTVQTRLASSGDYIEEGDPVLVLIGGKTLDIFLEIPETLGPAVAIGMPVTLSSRALPDWQQQATITATVPAADPASRQQRLRIQLDNPPADLVPGMAVRGEITLPLDTEGFIVPRDALTAREGGWRVFIVGEENTARELTVEPLADLGDRVAIAHPELQSGQTLVVQGGDGLQEGAAVKAIAAPQ